MNENWVPLFSGILESSVWGKQTDPEVKVLWITLLALKDIHGHVRASIPGLAMFTGLEIDQVMKALKVLEGPDPMSRTKAYEGRRLIPINGEHGWKVVNHEKYRDMVSKKMKLERDRKAQAKHREKVSREYATAEAAYVKADGDGEHEKANEIVDGLLKNKE